MKLLLISDDIVFSQTESENIFNTHIFPLLDNTKEIAILKPSSIEIYSIKMARKLNIPYIGFIDNAEAAAAYADIVFYVRKIGSEKSLAIIQCEFLGKPVSVLSIAA